MGFWRLWLSEHRSELLLDFMVGITVALAQIPGAIAFAFAAGVAPIIGLYASAILGITTATFGGRPGMVSGATGAVGIVQYNLVTEFNDLSSEEQLEEWGTNNAAEVLWAGLLLMGPIQIILGVTHFGAIVELIGVPTMIGFVNGLAILIARAQLTNFQRFVACAPNSTVAETGMGRMVRAAGGQGAESDCLGPGGLGDDPFFYPDYDQEYVTGSELGYMLMMCFLSILTVLGWPPLAKWLVSHDAKSAPGRAGLLLVRFLNAIPSTLLAILLSLLIEVAGNLGTLQVEDKAVVSGDFPTWHTPDVLWNGKTIGKLLPHALIWALVGMCETLIALVVISDMANNRGDPHREMIAQGTGNLLCGFTRALGGCPDTGASVLNVKCGGVRRRSGMLAALFMIIFVVALPSFTEKIPLGGLIGVMFVIVIYCFHWRTWTMMFRIPWFDSLVIIIVTAASNVPGGDLAIGVAVGIGLECVHYAFVSGRALRVEGRLEKDPVTGKEVKSYYVHGNLFFASSKGLYDSMQPYDDPAEVNIVLNEAKPYDHSAAESLRKAAKRYIRAQRRLRLVGLSVAAAHTLAAQSDIVKHLNANPDHPRSTEGDRLFAELKRQYAAQRAPCIAAQRNQ